VKILPELWRPKNLLLHHHNTPSHTSFIQGIIDLPTFLSYPPTLLLSVSKLKLKSRHFDTIEVMEAELQVVLDTVTEHDFQDAFRKWQKCWE
jgi:hypothetical protein